ncbi:general transcription factor II-I repeat domain-containing protein 2B-like [Brachionichthys hirsutus]|uniref:general transcription factor II-I repeat domain-containing protein 2B-like n=1 Tax=Brachionichthys hirsutus TaxID=412623 RepID=UPI0036044A49
MSALKTFNLNRHYTTKHADKFKNLTDSARAQTSEALLADLQKQQDCSTDIHAARDAIAKTSFVISYEIAKNGKSLSDGEFIKECLVDSVELICPEKKDAVERLSLSRKAVTKMIEDIAGNLELQLRSKAHHFDFFSLALSQSCDVSDTAQVLVFVRGITKDLKVTEELAAVWPMKGTTTGSDLSAMVTRCLDKLGLGWDRLAGVTTDGSPNPTGGNVGLWKQMQDKVSEMNPVLEFFFLTCIIQQNVLCTSVLSMNHVIEVVTRVVDVIRAQGFNHKQLAALLKEDESRQGGADDRANVRWLGRGRALKSFWDLRAEIQEFCKKKGKNVPEFSDADWMADLAFAVDVTALVDGLHAKLKRRDAFVHEMHALVKAFVSELQLLSDQLKSDRLAQMPALTDAAPSASRLRRFSSMLDTLRGEFSSRLEDFGGLEDEIGMITSPFTCSVYDAPCDVQLELIDLQSDLMLAGRFKTAPLLEFYAALQEENFPRMRSRVQKLLVLFGSTHACKQTFSVMKLTKSRCGSSLTDQQLSAMLRISTSEIQPDFDALVRAQQRRDDSQ